MTHTPARQSNRPAAAIALLAAFVRLLVLLRFSASPFYEPLSQGSDRTLYDEVARAVAAGAVFPAGAFEHMPLYGWFLGALYAVFGPSLPIASIAGLVLDAGTAALIVALARRCGAGPRWSLAGGAAYALYPLAVVYSLVPMPNILNAFLVTLFVVMAMSLRPDGTWRAWISTGLVAGIACLGFAGMLLVAPVTMAMAALAACRAGGLALAKCSAMVLACCLPLIPVAVHNTRAEGSFVLITAHGGFNFYMGNHEGATGYPVKIGSFRSDRESLLKDARAEAERAAGRPVTSAEFSSYWSDKARAFLRGEPAAAARLFGLKLMKFWNREEFDDLRLLPVLRLAGVVPAERWCVSFALIGTAGLAGLFLLRQARIAKFALAAGMLSLLLFFITARYRLTLVPLLCAVGAAGIGTVYAEGRYRSGAVALLVSAVVVLWPVSRPDFLALDRYKTAAHLLQAGMAEEALVQADLGLRTDPSVAGLHFVRGNALVGQGRWADAAESYAEAIRINPVMPDAHFNRAVCLKQVGDIAGAVAEAQLALELDPRHERAAGLIKELR